MGLRLAGLSRATEGRAQRAEWRATAMDTSILPRGNKQFVEYDYLDDEAPLEGTDGDDPSYDDEEPEPDEPDGLECRGEGDADTAPIRPLTRELDGIFGPGGSLARLFAGYIPRPGQVTLAHAIDANMANAKVLLAEAPTGVGKSVAALVPAIGHAILNAQRTVYVTGSIMLQEQLAKKDLPTLQKILPWPFKAVVMKGVSNYICRLAMESALMDPEVVNNGQLIDVAHWSQATKSGDLGDYDVELSALVRGKVTTTSEECVGQKCKFKDTCFLLGRRREAQAANVIVSNYHLFFADLAMRRDSERNRGIIPAYANVIFDEGHGAADIARNFFGFQMGLGQLAHAANRVIRIDPQAGAELKRNAERLFDSLDAHRRSSRYKSYLRGAWKPQELDWEPTRDSLVRAAKVASEESKAHEDPLQKKKLAGLAGSLERHAGNLNAAARAIDPDFVYYLDDLKQKGTQLGGMPIQVGQRLRRDLFAHSTVRSVTVMSATLFVPSSTRKKDAMIRAELGAESAESLEVPTPFDWAANAIVCLPPRMPLPNDSDAPAAVARAMELVIEAARGRTLGLFTSYRMLEHVHRHLQTSSIGRRFQVYRQGELPRAELVRRFREDVSSVLLGTASLWEGVDIQGEALSCVVIDKLPFESPDDPVAAKLSDWSKNYFKDRALPRAFIDFKQGIGRLLRTTTDRGAIVVLDPRVTGKPYGGKFVPGALPPGVVVHKGLDWASCLRDHLA